MPDELDFESPFEERPPPVELRDRKTGKVLGTVRPDLPPVKVRLANKALVRAAAYYRGPDVDPSLRSLEVLEGELPSILATTPVARAAVAAAVPRVAIAETRRELPGGGHAISYPSDRYALVGAVILNHPGSPEDEEVRAMWNAGAEAGVPVIEIARSLGLSRSGLTSRIQGMRESDEEYGTETPLAVRVGGRPRKKGKQDG